MSIFAVYSSVVYNVYTMRFTPLNRNKNTPEMLNATRYKYGCRYITHMLSLMLVQIQFS